MDIGIQQLMIGKTLKNEKAAREVLSLLKENHFNSIELDGFMIRKVPYLVKVLTDMSGMPTGNSTKLNWQKLIAETDLKVLSIHEDLGTLEEKTDMVIEECKTFKTDKVVITGMYQFDYDDVDELDKLVSRLNAMGKKLKENGIQLLYHNHNVEFGKLSIGMTSYEYIVRSTDPEYVSFEFDSYWATDAGVNCLQVMDLLGKRFRLYHINDRQKKKYGKAITPIVSYDAAELGSGIMDIESLINKAKELKVDAIILETHRNWKDGSPIESFKISGKYLAEHLN